MKLALIEATMHDLKGSPFKSAKGTGANWPLAVYRALKALAKDKSVKKKHINTFNLTVSISTVMETNDEHPVSTGNGPNKAEAA